MSVATSHPVRTAPRWLSWPVESAPVCVGLLLAFSVFLFFYGLNGSELWRTESLRAIIGQQMLESGNWIVPRLYGEPLFTKPPGMYIAIALCSLPVGRVTDFTARLPSALAATGCVLLFWWYFNRTLGRRAALAAGLILPMSLMWLDKASAAEIDTLQVFWVTASLLFLFRATEDDAANPFGWWLAALMCVAGGFLTKWTAPEFFYGTAIPYLWWRGRLRDLLRWPHLASLAIAAMLCLAWVAAAVHLEGWDVFWATVEREGGDRLVPHHDGRPYPWLQTLIHPAKLLATTLPWSALALLALRPSFFRLWNEREQRLLVALHCWVWPHMLFWSLPTEHTPRHSFPLFPGLAGLAAMVWYAWYDGRLTALVDTSRKRERRDWATRRLRFRLVRISPVQLLSTALAAWLVLKIVFVHHVMPDRCADREATAKGSLLAALVPLDEILYLFRLKDEGIMFYYGRPVLRLQSPAELPAGPAPRYCILTEEEWQRWDNTRPAEAVRRLTDEQGAPLVLVRVAPSHPETRT
jgi:4-amino-4-deoxy-L-arabinose transferase-like glycosyltransferase